MLGPEDDVPDSSQLGEYRPIHRAKLPRVEGLGQIAKEMTCIVIRRPHQRVADYCSKLAINTPVNEKTKALVTKPLQPVGVIARGLLTQSTTCPPDNETQGYKQTEKAGGNGRARFLSRNCGIEMKMFTMVSQ
jgi:hypothetical protein